MLFDTVPIMTNFPGFVFALFFSAVFSLLVSADYHEASSLSPSTVSRSAITIP